MGTDLIKRIVFPVLLLASGMAAFAQTGGMMRRAEQYQAEGKPREALKLWTRVWNDPDASPYARIEAGGKAGESLFADGRYEGAVRMLTDAVALADSVAPGRDAGNTLRYNTALHLTALGRYDDARGMLAGARFPAGSEGAMRSAAHLAEIESRTGNNRRAIEIVDSILSAFPEDGSNPESKGTLLQNRGFMSLEAGDEAGALDDFRTALGMVSGTGRMIVLSNLAMAKSLAGDCAAALADIDTALSYFLKELGKDSYDYINALRKKALIAGRCGDILLSSASARKFLALEKERLLRELPGMSEQTRLNYWLREKPLLSSLFSIPSLDAGILAEAAMLRRQVSMLGMRDVPALGKSLRLDAAGAARMLPADAVLLQLVEYRDEKGESRYDAIMLERSGKCRRIPLFGAEEIMDASLSDGCGTLYETVTGDDPDAINALYTDRTLSDFVWGSVMENLPSKTRDIYFVPEGIFHLWGIENMPLPDGMPSLHRLSSVQALGDAQDGAWRSADGEVIVAGGLDYSDTGGAASDDVEIDHSTYESLVRTLGVAPGSEIFIPLPATRIESDSVASALGGAARHVLRENEFKRIAASAPVIHLATHGYTLDSGIGEPPRFLADTLAVDMSLLLSGLAFTGANRAGLDLSAADDGVLSAREIASLDMSNVEMVVLSACQTARGVITDEGVSGLVRALKMAGVRTVVASLWEVDDNATRLFMQTFYEGLRSGLSRPEAFAKSRSTVAGKEQRIPVRRFDAGKMRRVDSGEVKVSYPYRAPFFHSPFIMID